MRTLALALATLQLCAQSAQDPARIEVFEAVPLTVNAGDPVELRWSTTGTDRIRLEPLDQEFPPIGHATYVPRERTVFWLHASNARGGQSVPLVVEVLPPGLPANLGPLVPVSPGAWIQLAALADERAVERLSQEVFRRTGTRVAVFEIEVAGQRLHRLRLGPYGSVREARKRLQGLQSRLKSLHLEPIVAVD